jgi:hypothetical protein
MDYAFCCLGISFRQLLEWQSMRSALLLILLLVFGPHAQGQSFQEIVQRQWRGLYTVVETGGQVDTVIHELYAIHFDSTHHYTGLQKTTYISKGNKSSAVCRIKGELKIGVKKNKAWLTYHEENDVLTSQRTSRADQYPHWT